MYRLLRISLVVVLTLISVIGVIAIDAQPAEAAVDGCSEFNAIGQVVASSG